MKLLLLLLFCIGLHAQTLDSPALAQFCNGVLYGPAQQADMVDLQAPFNNLIYAKSFQCVVPVVCTLCNITLGFVENRSLPIIGPGQRKFTVGINGNLSEVIDLYSIAGSKSPYTRVWTVVVYDGKLRLSFSASVLNALVSVVLVNSVYPPARIDPNPQEFNGTPDVGLRTICTTACFSQAGLTKLLMDPAWQVFWKYSN